MDEDSRHTKTRSKSLTPNARWCCGNISGPHSICGRRSSATVRGVKGSVNIPAPGTQEAFGSRGGLGDNALDGGYGIGFG